MPSCLSFNLPLDRINSADHYIAFRRDDDLGGRDGPQIVHRVAVAEEMYGLVRRSAQVARKALCVIVTPGDERVHARKQRIGFGHPPYFIPGVAGENKDRKISLFAYAPQQRHKRAQLLKRFAAADRYSLDSGAERFDSLKQIVNRYLFAAVEGMRLRIKASAAIERTALNPDHGPRARPVG